LIFSISERDSFEALALEMWKMVEELRIDIDEMDEVERNKFYEKVKTYIHE